MNHEIIQAARQLRMEHPGLTWGEACGWAFQCHVDYRKRKEIEDDNKRLAFLIKRKSEIRVEKYLARLRAAPLMRDHGNWDARESHGVNPVIQRAHGYRDLSDESMHAA